jgi:hypothetical protein
MTALALSRAEWQQLTVPLGTLARSIETGSLTTRGDGAELTYARNYVAGAAAADTVVGREGERVAAPAVVMLPVRAAPKQKFIPLSRREGVVLEVREDEFDARLVDLDGHEGDLDATFAIEELSPDDVALLRVGAVFYWTIGYFDDQVRRRTRVSDLRFRRLPAEDPRGLPDAEAEAEQIRRELGLT